MTTLKITGVEQTLKAMGRASVEDAVRVDDGLKSCAGVVLRKSLTLAPIDTGDLRASGRVAGNGKRGLGAEYTVSYGGPLAPHAFVVHEDLNTPHDPPTGAKYLTNAVRLTRGTCASIIRRRLSAPPALGVLSDDLDVVPGGV